MLYPFKFSPIFKEKIWGGTKLKSVLNKEIISDFTGESWEISGVANNLSVVTNGVLFGKNIQELIFEFKSEFLGQKVYKSFGNNFPLLIKFIDAADDLSVQVHPDDKFALKMHHENGKNEMWYILDSEKDSEIIVGLNQTISKKEYEKAVEYKTINKLLNKIKVKKGDAYYIPSGRIHAILKGVLLAEIQQSSDLTYRIYDWNRKGIDGKFRELHNDLAAEVVELEKIENYSIQYKLDVHKSKLASNQHFTVNKLKLNGSLKLNYEMIDSFVILMCVEGEFVLIHENSKLIIQKGETVLLPAVIKKSEIISETKSELLEIYV